MGLRYRVGDLPTLCSLQVCEVYTLGPENTVKWMTYLRGLILHTDCRERPDPWSLRFALVQKRRAEIEGNRDVDINNHNRVRTLGVGSTETSNI